MPKLNIYKRGDKILVKKGTVIYEGGGKQRIAGRDYVVTVHSCLTSRIRMKARK
jgi:hypothetical protein